MDLSKKPDWIVLPEGVVWGGAVELPRGGHRIVLHAAGASGEPLHHDGKLRWWAVNVDDGVAQLSPVKLQARVSEEAERLLAWVAANVKTEPPAGTPEASEPIIESEESIPLVPPTEE